MIRARWYANDKNWGDDLNPILINKISNQKVTYSKKLGHNKYIVIGSIMHYADNKSVVWGAGFISDKHKTRENNPKILAVRGPLTRKRLLELNIKCPPIYGDPALLYPRYYNPSVKKTHKIGIIPHYKDKDHPWIKTIHNAKIIDIQSGVEKVIDELKSCEIILSSSLHGIIAADAYGIPGYWIKLSNKLVGNEFKFKDYMLSVNREIRIIDHNTKLENQFYDYKIDINLDKLLNSCPFK